MAPAPGRAGVRHRIKSCLGHPRAAAFAGEILLLAALGAAWLALGAGTPDADALLFHPVPDAAEHAYVTRAFAAGRRALLPIANELHPSRYSPLHPLLASLYLRLSGGVRQPALTGYSAAALLAGMALFWIWLARAGLGLVWRVMALLLILFSPLCFALARGMMQEPTMFLLFAAACCSWFAGVPAISASLRIKRFLGYGAFCAAGVCAGGLACIRPTTLPLLPLIVAHLIWALGRRRGLRASAFVAAGAALCGAAVVACNYHESGMLNVVGYYHWDAQRGPGEFSWKQPWRRPANEKTKLPLRVIEAREALGIAPWATSLSFLSSLILIAGGLAGLGCDQVARAIRWRQKKRSPKQGAQPASSNPDPATDARAVFRSQAIVLGLFALSQFFIQACYFYHDVRFSILAQTGLSLCGVAGWEALVGDWLRHPHRDRRCAWILACCTVLTLSILEINEVLILAERAEQTAAKPAELQEVRDHRFNGAVARILKVPIFVGRGLALLNARLLLGLDDYPFPIAPLDPEFDVYGDPHQAQFAAGRVGLPVGYLNDRALWPDGPIQSALVMPNSGGPNAPGEVQRPALNRVLTHYGGLLLYYPSSRSAEAQPVLDECRRIGCTMRDLSNSARYTMILVRNPERPARGAD